MEPIVFSFHSYGPGECVRKNREGGGTVVESITEKGKRTAFGELVYIVRIHRKVKYYRPALPKVWVGTY